MKRMLFLCTFTTAILLCTVLHAADWSFSAEPLFGVQYGTVNEYVYQKNSSGDYQKLSELNWEMKPVLYYGGKLTLEWKNLQLSGYGKGFIPMKCGNMYDSDWQNITINDDADTKTNYSISENTVTSSYKLGADVSYTFYLDKYVSVQAIAAVDYMYTKMEARNGYGWYADKWSLGTSIGYSYDSNNAIYIPSGKLLGIDYTREDMLTWIGITNIITPFRQLSTTLSFFVSPYAYIQSIDHHYGKGYYIDIMSGFCSSYKFETTGMYNFTKHFSLRLAVSWIFSGIISGVNYYSTSQSGPWAEVSDVRSGADFNYVEASLSMCYSPIF
jgi:hypothetical protein